MKLEFKNIGTMIHWVAGTLLSVLSLTSCAEHKSQSMDITEERTAPSAHYDTITFATGCFWCTEAIFQRVKGVSKVTSGYMGGSVVNPTYEEVCTGTTGHAECCQIIYDSTIVSVDELLKIFWKTHDPTTLNRQGNDVGPQYRSVVFYHSESQKELAELYKAELDASGAFKDPIVTTIEPAKPFFSAEGYHQNYFNNNSNQMYCRYVIVPKIEKFEKVFKDKLKKAATE